jgi:hypothetical protein
MNERPYTQGLRTLMGKLWVERHVLELLAYKLVCAKLVMAADLRRYVGPALAGVQQVVEKVQVAELDRAITLAQLGEEWGMPPAALTLSYLAENAPEPARTMLEEHAQAFRRLISEIEETAAENRKLATAALVDIQTTLGVLVGTESGATYGATGHRESAPVPRRISRIL